MRAVAAVSIMMVVVGCSAPELACTEIGAPSGISVTVTRDVAVDLRSLTLEVCVDGRCTDHPVVLSPGSDTVDQGCAGAEPDAPCSATAVPNGTEIGFVDIADLPAKTMSVGVAVVSDAGPRDYEPVEVTTAAVYPNGPRCPAGGNQAKITISSSGVR